MRCAVGKSHNGMTRRTFTKAGLAAVAAGVGATGSAHATDEDDEIPGWIGKDTREASQTATLNLVPLVADSASLTGPQASVINELQATGHAKRVGYRPFELGRYHPTRGILVTSVDGAYREVSVADDGLESVTRDTLGVRPLSAGRGSPPAQVFNEQDARLARMLALRHQTVSSRTNDYSRARIGLTPPASAATELTANGKARGRPFSVNGEVYKPDPRSERLSQTANRYSTSAFAESQAGFEQRANERVDRVVDPIHDASMNNIITAAIDDEYTTDSPSDAYRRVLRLLFGTERAFEDHTASIKIGGTYYEALNRGVVF